MRLLIDGYNLMHAGGLLGRKFGPDEFRKVRTRFLNDLAAALGPLDAAQTAVVFDASAPPDHLPTRGSFKGLTVIYAVGDENADARIEQLIAAHSAPRSLKVVSSDRRVRQAATRRKAQSVTADDFWVQLDTLKRKTPARGTVTTPDPPPEPSARDRPLTPGEAAFWEREFADLNALPEIREALDDHRAMLTDAEIAALEREVAREEGGNPGPKKRPKRG